MCALLGAVLSVQQCENERAAGSVARSESLWVLLEATPAAAGGCPPARGAAPALGPACTTSPPSRPPPPPRAPRAGAREPALFARASVIGSEGKRASLIQASVFGFFWAELATA